MKTRIPARVIVGLLAGLFLAGTATRAANEACGGTWKADPEKSNYDPGPAPRENTVKIACDEIKFKVDARTTNEVGIETRISFDAKMDGKDYPLKGTPYADMISVKRIDANTIETAWKRSGKIVMTTRAVVSNDGKTRTVTFDGTDLQDRTVHNVVVYEKVK